MNLKDSQQTTTQQKGRGRLKVTGVIILGCIGILTGAVFLIKNTTTPKGRSFFFDMVEVQVEDDLVSITNGTNYELQYTIDGKYQKGCKKGYTSRWKGKIAPHQTKTIKGISDLEGFEICKWEGTARQGCYVYSEMVQKR